MHNQRRMKTSPSAKFGAIGRFLCFAVVLLALDRNLKLFANPTGMTVGSGSAVAQQIGSHLNVTTSPVAFLNWSGFNIQAGETTTFIQPSANSVVINQIGGASPSQIFGSLNANGTVILANANGFYFGPNSMISVGGSFIATTAPLTPDFGAGSAWQFTGMPPLASIVNYGQVKVGEGKSLYLIAEQIENHGELTAPGGDVGLYAGQEVLLSERADGRGFSANVKLPSGSVNNFGQITADAGAIALQAQVVNQNGLIQANSVQNVNGVIELVAGDSLNLGANSVISARGDETGVSAGGSVTIKSGNNYSDQAGSTIDISGGANGGNGGQVEISAPQMSSLQSAINGRAAASFTGGALTLDPANIWLASTASDPAATAGYTVVNVKAYSGLSTISVVADNNITLNTAWSLTDPGVPATLSLSAGNNIVLNNGSAIVAGKHWSVNLTAGTGFVPSTAQPTPAAGSDGVFLNGNSYVQTQDGDINLFASRDVTVTTGFINTANGGNISVTATYGSINGGNNNAGAANNASPTLTVDSDLNYFYFGGISTVNGGNVTLEAGNNVQCVPLPDTSSKLQMIPGASGAYGGGDVTVIAGNQITGNFLVSNGTGKLEAGVTVDNNNKVTINNPTADIGTATKSVTLSLISGNWDVYAARNLYLSEINNPNGTFDFNSVDVPAGVYAGNISSSGNVTLPAASSPYLFNYAPDSGAFLWAGTSMTLGHGITRLPGETGAPGAIYPPKLSLVAGLGDTKANDPLAGITLDTLLTLYPSSQGSIDITDGGNLSGVVVNTITTGIVMSDSGLPGFSTFLAGHAVSSLHLNDPNPVMLDVAGSIANFSLTVPTFADIAVGGNQAFTAPNGQNIFGTYNFNFHGQNLASSGANSATSINVAGDIVYQGLVTSVKLSDYNNAAPLPSEVFNIGISADPSVTQFLAYDPLTGYLSFSGAMTKEDLAFLQNPTIVVNGQAQTIPLTSDQKAALASLYANSQGEYASSSGLALNGPGQLSIIARNMDLGTSAGIQVNESFLPRLFATANNGPSLNGASLDISLSGNLELTTTAIENSGWQGAIQMTVGGTLDLGLQSLFGAPNNIPRGIYTTSDGNIFVTAGGDVDVNGSRITAYDGGNVTVVSQHGDVNAGLGGLGDVELQTELALGPDGKVTTLATGQDIGGSGIMAITDGASTIGVGDITVQAFQGSINANLGGIEQIPFNHISSPDNFIALTAGKDISAGNSGVIGSNIRTKAGGNISGIFVGSGSVNVNAGGNFSGTIVGSTTVSVAAGGSVSGTIVGGENVSVSGGEITASLLSGSVSTSGDASGASIGIPQSSATQQNAQVADNASTPASKDDNQDTDDLKKKKSISLAQRVGRVTVLLPTKTN